MLPTHDPREFMTVEVNNDGQPHPSYRIELWHSSSSEEQQRLSTATVSRATLAAIAHRAVTLLAATEVTEYGTYPGAPQHPVPDRQRIEIQRERDARVIDCGTAFEVDGQNATCARPKYHQGAHMSTPLPIRRPFENAETLTRFAEPVANHPGPVDSGSWLPRSDRSTIAEMLAPHARTVADHAGDGDPDE